MLEPTAKITLDKERTIRCDVNFWCLIDEKIGLQNYNDLMLSGGMGLRHVRLTLWAMLAAADMAREREPELSEARVGLLMSFDRFGEIKDAILTLMDKVAPQGQTSDEGGEETGRPLESTGTSSGPSE